MSIPSQHYAELADHSYQAPEKSKNKSGDYEYESVEIDGIHYRLLAHESNQASGYQRTIYQREDTSEMLVYGASQAVSYVSDKVKDGATLLGQQELQRAEMQAEASREVGQVTMRGLEYLGEKAKSGLDYGRRKADEVGDYLDDQIDGALEYGRGLIRGDPSTGRTKSKPSDYRDADHPDHALFQGLRERLPAGTADEKLAEIALACKQSRITGPDRITSVELYGSKATINGTQSWEVVFADLNAPAPRMVETMRKAEVTEQQQLAQLSAVQEQQMNQTRSLS